MLYGDENHRYNKWRGVTTSLRTGGQGQPTPIHTQRSTQPPFQHRHIHIHKKLLKHSFSHFSTHADGPMDRRTDKASYRVACPQLNSSINHIEFREFFKILLSLLLVKLRCLEMLQTRWVILYPTIPGSQNPSPLLHYTRHIDKTLVAISIRVIKKFLLNSGLVITGFRCRKWAISSDPRYGDWIWGSG